MKNIVLYHIPNVGKDSTIFNDGSAEKEASFLINHPVDGYDTFDEVVTETNEFISQNVQAIKTLEDDKQRDLDALYSNLTITDECFAESEKQIVEKYEPFIKTLREEAESEAYAMVAPVARIMAVCTLTATKNYFDHTYNLETNRVLYELLEKTFYHFLKHNIIPLNLEIIRNIMQYIANACNKLAEDAKENQHDPSTVIRCMLEDHENMYRVTIMMYMIVLKYQEDTPCSNSAWNKLIGFTYLDENHKPQNDMRMFNKIECLLLSSMLNMKKTDESNFIGFSEEDAQPLPKPL